MKYVFHEMLWKKYFIVYARLYILLTDQISLSDYFYFWRYWAKCVLQSFVNQDVTSYNLKLTLSFLSSRFATWPKSEDKKSYILRTKRAFDGKEKAFFIIFKGFQLPKTFDTVTTWLKCLFLFWKILITNNFDLYFFTLVIFSHLPRYHSQHLENIKIIIKILIKIFLKLFSFWDFENVKPKFQPQYTFFL